VNSDKKIHDYELRTPVAARNRSTIVVSATWAQAGQLEADKGLIRLAQGINFNNRSSLNSLPVPVPESFPTGQ
jgi:hypothetical protein